MNRRNTLQKKIIFDFLMQSKNHSTIEEIYINIKKEHPSISRATLYRNLRILAEDGLVHQLLLPGGAIRYEKNTKPHHHFKCKICSLIFDIELDNEASHINSESLEISQKYGYCIEDKHSIFYGICNNCSK